MQIRKIQIKSELNQEKKLSEKFESFQKLLNEINKKDIPIEMANSINLDIDDINKFSGSGKDMLKRLRKKQLRIIKILEKELQLVTINHYRNRWLALGMSVFGIPIGVALGISVGNLGLLGIGLPIGLGIGIIIGTAMDKKAKVSGKQLDVELKY